MKSETKASLRLRQRAPQPLFMSEEASSSRREWGDNKPRSYRMLHSKLGILLEI